MQRKRKISHREHRDHRESRGGSADRRLLRRRLEVHKTAGFWIAGIDLRGSVMMSWFDGVSFQRQLAVDVLYKGYAIQGQRLDLLVANSRRGNKIFARSSRSGNRHVLSYLKATGLKWFITEFWRSR
jgi:hypothetical protein